MSPPPPKAPSGDRPERQLARAAAIHEHSNASFADQVEWFVRTGDFSRSSSKAASGLSEGSRASSGQEVLKWTIPRSSLTDCARWQE